MHGQAKVLATEKEKREREQKVKVYKESMNKIFEKRKNGEFNEETLGLISDILVSNPDIYTLWNFRKEILLTFKDRSHDDLGCILSNEMRLTETCLRANPKSYCAWYHRLWILDNLPNPDLEKELFLCTKYLKLDERNFHCWDYRRAVVNKLGLSPSEEIDYSTVKIEENFSNYSSWHYRSKLLPFVYPDTTSLRPVDEPTHVRELELVQSACFTDPSDSSSWFYLRWLLGRPSPVLTLAQALWTGSVLVLVFTRPPTDLFGWKVFPANPHIWIKEVDVKKDNEDLVFKVDYGEGDKEIVLTKDNHYIWSTTPRFDPIISSNLISVLEATLKSSDQLLELEPESKWTLLTSIVLMQAIDRNGYKDKILDRLSLLVKFDPCRTEYYKDMRSKYLVEQQLEQLDSFTNEISFSKLNLSSLFHTHYFACASVIDFSKNNLSRSLRHLSSLFKCENLNLDSNKLSSLKGFPKLKKLKILSLRSNNLTKVNEILPYLVKLDNLHTLDLTDNPLSSEDINVLKNNIPNVHILYSS